MSLLSLAKQHEELQHVINQLDAESKTPTNNRRSRARKTINIPLSVYLIGLPGTPMVKVHGRNISVGGVSFLSKRSFPVNSYIAASFNLADKTTIKFLLTKVLFCRYVRQGHFQVGATFVEGYDGTIDNLPRAWVDQATEAMILENMVKS